MPGSVNPHLGKNVKNLFRLIHTVCYLRPVQIYGRLWHLLFRPRPDESLSPAVRPFNNHAFVPTASRRSSQLGPWHFRFLNRESEVERPGDWNAPDLTKLWLYNLHYFDDLNAQGASQRSAWHRVFINRWIAENPPGQGNGWESYPTSLRIVNWVKWALAGNALEMQWKHSLAVQARWLRKRLEWHLLGNHLFANAKALVFAGAFFDGQEAEAWLAKGLEILAQEIPEQVLDDGGHFERSPMYHAIILEDLLDLLNLARAFPDVLSKHLVIQWEGIVQRMRHWLAAMIHPDGGISFFNDAAFSIAPDHAALVVYAERLGLPNCDSVAEGMMLLPDSGYIRLARGAVVALLDVAPVGPDYLPGHAHADSLSFEMSLFGRRLLVNSGTSEYGLGPERSRQRGTAAHNTVTINGENSTEVWGGFRAARRAYPIGLTYEDSEEALIVRCAHDGYRRLSGKPLHHREWRLGDSNLSIRDDIKGRFDVAVARYFLHPEVEVESNRSLHAGELRLKGCTSIRWRATGGEVRVVSSSFHPEFGLSLPSHCIEVTFTEASCEIEFSWD